MAQVLVVLPEGFEEIEAVTPIDLLRRAGNHVKVAALGPEMHVTGRSGITVHTDGPLSAADLDAAWDMIVLPGGPGVKHLRADGRLKPLLRRQARVGGWIAAICAAPTVLADAGLLEGKAYTCHVSVAPELSQRRAEERVVVDGRIITSRGAGTSIDFGLALITALQGEKAAADIAGSIAA